MDRLEVPGKTYSLMLSRMLLDRVRGRTAVDGRAGGCEDPCFSRSWCIDSVGWASAAAAGSIVGLRRVEELLREVSKVGRKYAGRWMDALPELVLPLIAAFIEPCKVGALPAAVRAHWHGVAWVSQREFRLLQASRLQRRLQINGRTRGQAYFGLASVGVAVLCPALLRPRHGTKVQLWVDVLHAMVGRLEVLEDGATCQAQLLLGVGVEDAAVDVGRVVGDAVFRRVSAVRL
jgi:hypothetical protein